MTDRVAGLSTSETALLVAALAALATLGAAIIAAAATYLSQLRSRRRNLYGQAVQAAVAWRELLYRVRRRADNDADARDIIHRFHEAQEALELHRGWIGSESRVMARSYDRLIDEIKYAFEPLIREAWKQDVRPVPGDAIESDQHPDIQVPVGRFLCDVRAHLSFQPWKRVALLWRYRHTAQRDESQQEEKS